MGGVLCDGLASGADYDTCAGIRRRRCQENTESGRRNHTGLAANQAAVTRWHILFDGHHGAPNLVEDQRRRTRVEIERSEEMGFPRFSVEHRGTRYLAEEIRGWQTCGLGPRNPLHKWHILDSLLYELRRHRTSQKHHWES